MRTFRASNRRRYQQYSRLRPSSLPIRRRRAELLLLWGKMLYQALVLLCDLEVLALFEDEALALRTECVISFWF
ncbi:hypothetical protein CEXT_170301 [Caerostris extrusa]|uniref:Uncharacterized protein n=1 Tax=Caerostris extrusa TaxID=172846 RepID=A0AAV4U634_CAEEX|nr:hypothetical protein CEXT_170301 [Caerostris extrusa]